MRLIYSLVLMFHFGTLEAAPLPMGITYKQSLKTKTSQYLKEGVFTGGIAGSGTSVLGIRRIYSASLKTERVIVDMGDKEGKPEKGQMGYFQAAIDNQLKRIILDVAQLRMANVSEPKLKELFKKSPFVESAEFTADPEDKSGKIVLKLKRPMKLEVFQLVAKDKPARLVMDLKPIDSAIR